MALLDQHPHSEMNLRSRRWWRVWFLVVFLLPGCTGVPAIPPSGDILLPSSNSSERNVSVVSNWFHTALVVARGDLPARHIPELADFPDARFLEFSWGDAEYFPRGRGDHRNCFARGIPTHRCGDAYRSVETHAGGALPFRRNREAVFQPDGVCAPCAIAGRELRPEQGKYGIARTLSG